MSRTASIPARRISARQALLLSFLFTLTFLLVACDSGTSSPSKLVSQVVVEPAGHTIGVGEQLAFSARVFDDGGDELEGRTVTWASSNESVATIATSGVVTGAAAGTASISATVDGITGSTNIGVQLGPVASVEIALPQLDLFITESRKLVAVVKDAAGRVITGQPVTWASDDTTIVSVDATGRLTALQAGSATVSAMIDGYADSTVVTVTLAPVTAVEITPAAFVIEIGEQKQLQAIVRDALGRVVEGADVMWTVDDGTVRITQDGLVTGLRNGYVTVFAISDGVAGAVGGTIVYPPPYEFDLVYYRVDPMGSSELLILDLESLAAPTRLNAGTVSRMPTASPDGSRVAFAVSMEEAGTGNWIHNIYAVDRTGMNMKRLTTEAGYDEWPEWSPTGGRIVYQHVEPDGRSDIWAMKDDGTGQINLTLDMPGNTFRSSPTWTRDGSRIAFSQRENTMTGTIASIWIMDADGSSKRQLTTTLNGFDTAPTWSPDGVHLAFMRYYGHEPDITIMDVNTGATNRISLPGVESNPAWSPDGTLIAFTLGNSLYTMAPDGKKLRLRSVDPSWGSAIAPSWIRHR